MRRLYVYAVLSPPARALAAAGLRGEPMRLVRADGFAAAVSEMAAPPAPTPRTLRGHDAAVRRLAAAVPAVLPARFGSMAEDPAALAELLRTHAGELREALRLVRGREQMTLRVHGRAPARPAARGADAGLGPGARYLRRQVRERDAIAAALAPLRRRLAPLLAAERIEASAVPPLRGSVYHLISRGQAAAYRAAVRGAGARPGVRVTVSGPWPPYAFVPEVLS